jgi:hypothetical protein
VYIGIAAGMVLVIGGVIAAVVAGGRRVVGQTGAVAPPRELSSSPLHHGAESSGWGEGRTVRALTGSKCGNFGLVELAPAEQVSEEGSANPKS